MTLLIASVSHSDCSGLIRAAENAARGGADAVELRLDGVHGDLTPLPEFIRKHTDRRWIITCRSIAEGGAFAGDWTDNLKLLEALFRSGNTLFDIEFSSWDRSYAAARELGLETEADAGERLILSAHFTEGRPSNLHDLARRMLGHRHSVAKIAYAGHTAADGFAAADILNDHAWRAIAVCMGEAGAWTRVLARKLGAFATFAAADRDHPTAAGQMTVPEMISVYRWPDIDRRTRVFGLIGDPVAHSLGPLLHNRWFADFCENAVYLPFRVPHEPGALARFLDGCAARPWLDIGGFSVTIPHKENALAWLGESANSMSRTIGAANTICFGKGKFQGFNTDCYAALDSLAEALGCSRVDLAGFSIDVLGSGGSALALVNGLTEVGSPVTIYTRNPQRAARIAAELDCKVAGWDQRLARRGDIVVNCTPIGMQASSTAPPSSDGDSPLPANALAECRLVFDMIYRPRQTALLRMAKTAGCRTLDGLDMFIRQAAMQFTLWTGRTPDRAAAARWLGARLAEQEADRAG